LCCGSLALHIELDPSLAFFVTRAKSNFVFKRLYSLPVDKSTGVRADQIITVTRFYTLKDYPEKLRRIRFFDAVTQKQFVFLTNNFRVTGHRDCPSVQVSLAGRVVLQVDQAAPADQGFLWRHRSSTAASTQFYKF
jgi:hypothetical protein